MRITSRSIQGGRPYQEDRYLCKKIGEHMYLFGIFDGHGGSTVSDFCKKNIVTILKTEISHGGLSDIPVMLRKVFYNLDKLIDALNVPYEGSTVVICFMYNKHVFFANAGDSMGYVFNNGTIKDMTYEHKASNKFESKRITDNKGVIMKDHFGIDRVFGSLNLSRSIGDFYLKQWVISDPFVSSMYLENLKTSQSYIFLASDGIWDVMDFQDVHSIVTEKNNTDEENVTAIVQQALKRGSMDNITCVLINFD